MDALHSFLTDGVDLDRIVERFVLAHPNCGQRMLVGHIRSLGLHISRQRVRDSLIRTDPLVYLCVKGKYCIGVSIQ